MKWFEGSISDAVAASKSQNAVFVVYIEGTDERSTMMTTALDIDSVSTKLESKKFVCIKLAKDSEGHSQFSQIYKLVPVPSLFLIGSNGIPLEVVPGETNKDSLIKKLVSAVTKASGEPLLDTAPSVSSAGQPSDSVTEPLMPETVQEVIAASPSEPPAEALNPEYVQELLKKKREENKKKDEEKEKEAEIRRRQQGHEVALARKKQQERELDELRREREQEKKEEAAARERVLRQINEDREARLARQQTLQTPQVPPAPTDSVNQSPRPSSPPSNSTRIQFKLPDCQTHTQTFSPSDTIQDLRNFIDTNIKLPFREYTLATTFPRREFTVRDLDRDLKSLELVPSGVILIMPLSHGVISTRTGWGAAFWALLWDMVQPIFYVGRYIRSFISGSSESEPGPSSSGPSPSPPAPSGGSQQQYPPPNAGSGRTVRKRGNIHTLHDGDDSNDENNTWNGNSTQLM